MPEIGQLRNAQRRTGIDNSCCVELMHELMTKEWTVLRTRTVFTDNYVDANDDSTHCTRALTALQSCKRTNIPLSSTLRSDSG